MKKTVVVIGGGYGGIRAIEHLKDRDDLEIVLLDRHPYHYLQPEIYDFIANKSEISDVTIDLFSLCEGFGESVKFFKRDVLDIDVKEKVVITDIDNFKYDYLIISAGARTNFNTNIEGLKECTHGVKSLKRALEFKQKFESAIYRKLEAEGGVCTEKFNIVIGGAGISGVEIAAEMAYYSREFYRNGAFNCDNINVYLISSQKTVLPGLDKYLIEKSTKRLLSLGVKIITNKKISKVEQNAVYFNDGTSID
ncbi:MAG: FAD-dependent oxidoreductase, partial [Campylobacterales bacterium]|nr:FAD-dependent oxidoreductase [Campylobacterales bacterium]